MKKNAIFTVIEIERNQYRKKDQAKVLSVEIIELEYNPGDKNRMKKMKIAKILQL